MVDSNGDAVLMNLTAIDRQQLRMVRDFRDAPPTVLHYVKTNWKSTLLIGVLCTVAAVVYYRGGWPVVSGFFVGTLFGVITRDAGWYRKLVRSWPLSREITDWSRVDELIERNP
jgi:hypothetical protein